VISTGRGRRLHVEAQLQGMEHDNMVLNIAAHVIVQTGARVLLRLHGGC
jgi:hypothetical protein